MDEYSFQLYTTPGSTLWLEELLIVNKSAFMRYTHKPFEAVLQNNHQNANKRMIEFLRKIHHQLPVPVIIQTIDHEKERIQKHKMSERMRRGRHSQNYVALHKLLPHETKGKKSILEMAAKEIEELQLYKEELKRKNREMEMMIELAANKDGKAVEKAEIKLKVDYPASGINSMMEALRCLRDTGSTATAIQSKFSKDELEAVIAFETKVTRAADVEKAIQTTLFEAEMKFRQQI